MSETTSEACGSPNCPAPPGSGTGEDVANPVGFCDRIVEWVATSDTISSRVNYAEANRLSEGDVAAANEEAVETLLEIMDLAAIVSDMHAATQNEVEAKKRALDALTSIPAWERDSLYELRHSIERDQLEVNARLYAASLEPTQRAGWLSRLDQG